jgi:hypothetical protein
MKINASLKRRTQPTRLQHGRNRPGLLSDRGLLGAKDSLEARTTLPADRCHLYNTAVLINRDHSKREGADCAAKLMDYSYILNDGEALRLQLIKPSKE